MPVLESADTQVPRSTLRHRSLTDVPKQKRATTEAHPVVQRASRPHPKPADDDLVVDAWQREDADGTPGSRRTTQSAPRRGRSKTDSRATARRSTGLRTHPLLLLGLGMLAMLALDRKSVV